ncbi:flavin reductase family protein [Herbidospora galbida]|uniref:Flavin reductase family protein n=1 Tax=Herbidospora galbida TaxID=2575442 RepID=A0A4U3MEN0_9ACTN|nr:flavin reductase family protein [Herbidospora galbida]TKK87210.1 flavin reductase family protein [Herbidospora galbida]
MTETVGDLTLTDAFRGFMSTYFTGVSIVTSIDREGRPHGLTCNSLASVTLRPPTLLVCLDRHSGTLDAVLSRSAFAVNLLNEDGRGAAEAFSTATPARFTQVAWRRSPGSGLPVLISAAYASAECEVVTTTAVGDHMVVYGRVVAVRADAARPLLYGMRTFTTLGEKA